ncbi:hypothetical protein HPNQ4099_1644 [Helicobacter pylori NQ4099]|uniref:Uncharacterized protein n=1 Tax=Helicobacter pylori NQ4099 TaxID=992026 RepID=I9PZP5_HELPX|nr:hypothetical protein HPNQ4099_1644 [Helicobacter pylori NQ4099]
MVKSPCIILKNTFFLSIGLKSLLKKPLKTKGFPYLRGFL